VVNGPFLDTSVLIGGVLDGGSNSIACRRILDELVAGELQGARTAWHCCLEFYAVLTRMPQEQRIPPSAAWVILRDDLLPHLSVVQLPTSDRERLLAEAAAGGVAGGRLYDHHIAEIAVLSGASTLVTDNTRHFLGLASRGVAVVTSEAFAARH
jgi:hypothetical protein